MKQNEVKQTKPCFVICLNDYPQHVLLTKNEAEAKKKMEELSERYFEKNKLVFKDDWEYKHRCYWHLEIVPYEPVSKEMT